MALVGLNGQAFPQIPEAPETPSSSELVEWEI